MCTPIDVLCLDKKGSLLLHSLVMELHNTWGELLKEPLFAENPCGYNTNDILINVNHATEHIQNALHIIAMLHDGKFVKEEGGG